MDDMSVVADSTKVSKRVDTSDAGTPPAWETPESRCLVGEREEEEHRGDHASEREVHLGGR
jgi:hypothetical protein